MKKATAIAVTSSDTPRPAWASKLRHYQWDGALWLHKPPAGLRGRLLNDDRGFGKTACALAAARLRQDAGLSDNKCVLVLTTASARFDWRRDAAKFWPEARCMLINEKPIGRRVGEAEDAYRARRQPWRELLYGNAPAVLACSFSTLAMEQLRDFILENDIVLDTVIVDECFPAGTQVNTRRGTRSIEELRVGESVLAFNPETGTTSVEIIRAISSRVTEHLLELVFPTHSIKVTPNHPFLTSEGWKKAEALREGDAVVQLVQEETREVLPQPKAQSILQSSMLSSMAYVPPQVRGDVEHPRAYGANSEGAQGRSLEKPQVGSGVLSTYETQKPHAQCGNARSSLCDVEGDGASPGDSRRQWTEATQASTHLGSSSGLADRSSDSNGENLRSSELHQGGHRQLDHEGSSGSRWNFPQHLEAPRAGPTEGFLPSGFRLVRLQGVKHHRVDSDSTNHRVYNLEVSGPHTYAVNGIVVHNCHYLKYAESETSKAARFLIGRSTVNFLLTATAVHNTAIDLHNLLDIMAMGKWGTKWNFARKYFQIHTTEAGYQTIGQLIDKEGLKRDIAIACLKRSITEAYGELPAVQRELRRVDVGPTYRISRESARKLCDGGAMNTALRRAAGIKLRAASEFIADLDEPLVAYTHERKHAAKLVELLTKLKVTCTLATGDTPGPKRDALIEAWKAGSSRVLVCTMDAVKESATLVRAAAMVFCDLDWLPGKQLQCEGRIDPARQPEGQRRPVRYYYFVVDGGPDEVVAERVIEKIQQSAGLIGDDSPLLALAGTLSPMKRVLEEVSLKDALSDLVARIETRAENLYDLGLSEDDLEM